MHCIVWTKINFHKQHRSKEHVRHLGAVGNDKEGLAVHREGLHVVGLADLQDVDVLDLDEAVGRRVALVDVRATNSCATMTKRAAVDHHRLADHGGGTWRGGGGGW